jgi:hypothetical protein
LLLLVSSLKVQLHLISSSSTLKSHSLAFYR